MAYLADMDVSKFSMTELCEMVIDQNPTVEFEVVMHMSKADLLETLTGSTLWMLSLTELKKIAHQRGILCLQGKKKPHLIQLIDCTPVSPSKAFFYTAASITSSFNMLWGRSGGEC